MAEPGSLVQTFIMKNGGKTQNGCSVMLGNCARFDSYSRQNGGYGQQTRWRFGYSPPSWFRRVTPLNVISSFVSVKVFSV